MSKQSYESGKVEIEGLTKEQLGLYPVEQMAPVKKKMQRLQIGLPKENHSLERRVALRPEAVEVLCRKGHEVIVETGAGLDSSFTDKEYSDAGAKISYSREEVLKSHIVLKIALPTTEELEYLSPNATLISALESGKMTIDHMRTLLKKKITAIAFDFLQDPVGGMPVVRAMSEIAGSTVMLVAAEHLSSQNGGQGIILGGVTGVPPTKVVIVGAGTVGEYAARTALGLGAEIKVFDRNTYKLRRLKYSIGHQVYTCTLDPLTLGEAVSRADVIITAMRARQGRSPVIITEEMVMSMKPNSVIIDVSIDQGGCVETSEPTTLNAPTFRRYDVIHYCVPNIASRVARTSSTALSNIFTPHLIEIGDCGGVGEMIYTHKWFMKGVYTFHGSITNHEVAKRFNLPHKDLSLLMAARM